MKCHQLPSLSCQYLKYSFKVSFIDIWGRSPIVCYFTHVAYASSVEVDTQLIAPVNQCWIYIPVILPVYGE